LLKHVSFPLFAANDVPYYEKADIRIRMEEKREVVSVVKVVPHPTQKKTKVLDMTAAGVMEGVTIPQAMKLMSDYENLQKIAPEYIKLSEVIQVKEKDKIQKYLHMKAEVSALLISYKLEIYAKVHEETREDKGIVYWEIVPVSALGRKETTEKRFVGLKGQVIVEKYKRAKNLAQQPAPPRGGRGFYRTHPKQGALLVLFKGKMDRKEKLMDEVIPNLMIQFAMEVGLQRVGVLLRNYMETAKEEPKLEAVEVD
jgi:hypothetical protein